MALYDRFASEYSSSMGEEGDYFHRTQIDPYIFQMLGDIKDKEIYDLGCGNGYLARKMVKMGARVTASDESRKLIEIAEKLGEGRIRYRVHDGTDFGQYKDKQFDAVVMNMVVHYIKDLEAIMEGVARVLKKDGKLVFSMPHFLRPMHPYAEWIKGQIGGKERLFVKVTGYLKEEGRKTESVWGKSEIITLYNRPMKKYVEAMAQNGLYITELAEPESKGFAKQYDDKLQKSHQIPTFMIVAARKIG